MPTNLIKIYNQLLEIAHLSETARIVSLKRIFDRDITDNLNFNFRSKIIRPLKIDGLPDMQTLFGHLTCQVEEQIGEDGKIIKSRSVFDYKRSERLHWIRHHIEEKTPSTIDVFSYLDRINSKDVIRTYILDETENYVIVLEPQRSQTDYYLLTAYYLTKEKGGIKQMKKKSKKRLAEVY